ncbi:hypothetical protein F8388_007228 [Cannabis sativa]|uniref:Uncharacterized protein n=1 Tax=Cannabis sativa TaxID=3483 RepID=A0A7J6EH44_CANSA|nr:hypothetical protein F8388_007228 [Cannabis sativa]
MSKLIAKKSPSPYGFYLLQRQLSSRHQSRMSASKLHLLGRGVSTPTCQLAEEYQIGARKV